MPRLYEEAVTFIPESDELITPRSSFEIEEEENEAIPAWGADPFEILSAREESGEI